MNKKQNGFEFTMESASREQYEEDVRRSRKNRHGGSKTTHPYHLDMTEIRWREKMFPSRKIPRRVRVGNQIVVGPE